MKPRNNTMIAFVAIFVLGIVGAVLYFLVPPISAFILGGLTAINGTVLLACATLLLSSMILARGLSRRHEPRRPEAAAKEALYEGVLSAWSAAIRQQRRPEGAEVAELERRLVLRAPRGVLDAYLRLRRLEEGTPSASDVATRGALERLVAEIRKDLGHRELPWTSAAAVELLLRQDPPPAGVTPGSREFKVVRED